MGINLQKGQKIDLSKGGAGGSGLRRVMVGLGWMKPPVAAADCLASVSLSLSTVMHL